MKSYFECVPCFFQQALDSANIAGANESEIQDIINKVANKLQGYSMDECPPFMGRFIYEAVRNVTGKADPYKEIKERSNKMALNLYPVLKEKIEKSSDSLLQAIELAIAGNIIDYGLKTIPNIDKEIEKALSGISSKESASRKALFHYDSFKENLSKVDKVLYLGDNTGEIVFDKILIEVLTREPYNKQVTYVVRSNPIINDALVEDALLFEIDKIAHIMTSGTNAPGTVLKTCSSEFLELFNNASMIISKGQGNFEALTDEEKPIFFLFMVKCDVISQFLGLPLGEKVLMSKKESYIVNPIKEK